MSLAWILAFGISSSGLARAEWPADYIARLSEADCKGIATSDRAWCETNDCRGIASKDRAYCDSNDCRGVALGDRAYCDTALCRAWALKDRAYCDNNDCRGVALGDFAYCDSAQCKAIARKDPAYCSQAQTSPPQAPAKDLPVFEWADPGQKSIQWTGTEPPLVPAAGLGLYEYRRDIFDDLLPTLRIAYALKHPPTAKPNQPILGRTPEGWPVEIFATGIKIQDTTHNIEIWQQKAPQELTQLKFPNGMAFAFMPGREGRILVTGKDGGQNYYSIGSEKAAPVLTVDPTEVGVLVEQRAPQCQSVHEQRHYRIGNTELRVSGVSFGASEWLEKATGVFRRRWRPRCEVIVDFYHPPGTRLPKEKDRERSFHLHLGDLGVVVFTKDDERLSRSSGSRHFYIYSKDRAPRANSPETSQLKIEILPERKARIRFDAHEEWIVNLDTAEVIDSNAAAIEVTAPLPASPFPVIAKHRGGWSVRPKREGDLVIADQWLLGPQSPSLSAKAEVWQAAGKPCMLDKKHFFRLREAGNDDLDPISSDHSELLKRMSLCK